MCQLFFSGQMPTICEQQLLIGWPVSFFILRFAGKYGFGIFGRNATFLISLSRMGGVVSAPDWVVKVLFRLLLIFPVAEGIMREDVISKVNIRVFILPDDGL